MTPVPAAAGALGTVASSRIASHWKSGLLPHQALVVALVAGLALAALSIMGDRPGGWRVTSLVGNLAAPWALGAFVVGRLAASPRRGAVAGALTLVAGVSVYYAYGAVQGYVFTGAEIVWTGVALVAGPVMGLCGGAVAAGRGRTLVAAAAAPAAMLLAEAAWVVADRRIWLWDLGRQPYRLIDLGVILAFVALALAAPRLVVEDRDLQRAVYGWALAGGLFGAVAFSVLHQMLVAV